MPYRSAGCRSVWVAHEPVRWLLDTADPGQLLLAQWNEVAERRVAFQCVVVAPLLPFIRVSYSGGWWVSVTRSTRYHTPQGPNFTPTPPPPPAGQLAGTGRECDPSAVSAYHQHGSDGCNTVTAPAAAGTMLLRTLGLRMGRHPQPPVVAEAVGHLEVLLGPARRPHSLQRAHGNSVL